MMKQPYQKIQKQKRVSFDDSTRFDYDAQPRNSLERPPHHRPNSGDDSDDEIDNLLADDPLYDEKESQRGGRRGGGRLSRRGKRILIIGFVALVLGLIVALSVVGVQAHTKPELSKGQMDKATMEEVKGMTEVTTLIGNVPIKSADMPTQEEAKESDNSKPSGSDETEHTSGKQEQIISVPATDISPGNEAADKAAYDADSKMDDVEVTGSSPPELSPEAVAQAQNVNSKLTEAGVAVANSASGITKHKDPVQSLKAAANELLAWINAQLKDVMGNKEGNGEVIY